MKINKQLFEDILLGKLKGTFILRANNRKVNSEKLERNNFCYSYTHPYRLLNATYNSNGKTSLCDYETPNDIIDFIPDINMKKNELTIEIPEGKIVDWKESEKQNKIVLKDKQLTYEGVCKKLFNGETYYTNTSGKICSADITQYVTDPNNATTKHQLECILAKNKLANVAKYLNGNWEPYKTDLGHFDAWVLFATPDKDFVGYSKITDCAHNSNVLFRSPELAKQAVKILGEETVKLALEPLGI